MLLLIIPQTQSLKRNHIKLHATPSKDICPRLDSACGVMIKTRSARIAAISMAFKYRCTLHSLYPYCNGSEIASQMSSRTACPYHNNSRTFARRFSLCLQQLFLRSWLYPSFNGSPIVIQMSLRTALCQYHNNSRTFAWRCSLCA